jgi:hypothetical protein
LSALTGLALHEGLAMRDALSSGVRKVHGNDHIPIPNTATGLPALEMWRREAGKGSSPPGRLCRRPADTRLVRCATAVSAQRPSGKRPPLTELARG